MTSNHSPRRAMRRTSATVAAIAMAATALVVPSANALRSDNVHGSSGGGVNIHADNTCVNKIGDTAHVKFEVQHQPLVLSSDHTQSAIAGLIALPKDMKNVKIKIVATGALDSIKNEKGEIHNRNEFAKYEGGVELPIVDYKESIEKFPEGYPSIGMKKYVKNPDTGKYDLVDFGLPRRTYEDPDDPTLTHTNYLPTEQALRDHIEKYDIHARKTPAGADSRDRNDVYSYYDAAWYGVHDDDYDYYSFGNTFMPISFEIEGDVEVKQEDMYLSLIHI